MGVFNVGRDDQLTGSTLNYTSARGKSKVGVNTGWELDSEELRGSLIRTSNSNA